MSEIVSTLVFEIDTRQAQKELDELEQKTNNVVQGIGEASESLTRFFQSASQVSLALPTLSKTRDERAASPVQTPDLKIPWEVREESESLQGNRGIRDHPPVSSQPGQRADIRPIQLPDSLHISGSFGSEPSSTVDRKNDFETILKGIKSVFGSHIDERTNRVRVESDSVELEHSPLLDKNIQAFQSNSDQERTKPSENRSETETVYDRVANPALDEAFPTLSENRLSQLFERLESFIRDNNKPNRNLGQPTSEPPTTPGEPPVQVTGPDNADQSEIRNLPEMRIETVPVTSPFPTKGMEFETMAVPGLGESLRSPSDPRLSNFFERLEPFIQGNNGSNRHVWQPVPESAVSGRETPFQGSESFEAGLSEIRNLLEKQTTEIVRQMSSANDYLQKMASSQSECFLLEVQNEL